MRTNWVVWAIWSVTLALLPVALAFGWLARSVPLPEEREGFLPLIAASGAMALVYSTVGLVIATRQRGNAIGWIFLVIGFGLALMGAAYGYGDYGIYGGADVPAPRLAAWTTSWLFIVPVFIAPCFVLFLFPTGRPPSPAWGRALWIFIPVAIMAVVGSAFEAGELVSFPGVENPLGLPGSLGNAVQAVDAVGEAIGAPTVFLLSLASIIARYRRATGAERLQIKWMAYAAAMMAVCFAGSFLAGEVLPSWMSDLLFILGFAGFGGLAVAAGLAILRYRLYEIDRIISRTLVYGLLTVMLALTYFGLVVGLQALLRPVSGGSDIAIVVTTLVVAALFLPARRRIQEVVDRRFNRRAYDAARTVEAFSARLREQIDLDTLRYELLAVVDETMQPARASVWLRRPRSEG